MLNIMQKNRPQEEPASKALTSPAAQEAAARSGWFSPRYTSSQPVELDPALLEQNRIVAMQPDRPETESYKLLRTQILHRMQANGWNSLMITSPEAGDGKTTTAINLAVTFAREYSHTALLVDCDLKQQTVHKLLGYPSEVGLVDYLINDRPMTDLIVWPGIEKLTVISGGPTIQDSTELLGSQRMRVLVQEMKSRYEDRFVFFDVPPLLTVADAVAFAPMVDAVLMVVREGRTPLPGIRQARALIPRERFLGYVLNGRLA